MFKPDDVTVPALRNAVSTILSNERYVTNARKHGDYLRASEGVQRAVDDIEALIS